MVYTLAIIIIQANNENWWFMWAIIHFYHIYILFSLHKNWETPRNSLNDIIDMCIDANRAEMQTIHGLRSALYGTSGKVAEGFQHQRFTQWCQYGGHPL